MRLQARSVSPLTLNSGSVFRVRPKAHTLLLHDISRPGLCPVGSQHWASLPGIWHLRTFCSVISLGFMPSPFLFCLPWFSSPCAWLFSQDAPCSVLLRPSGCSLDHTPRGRSRAHGDTLLSFQVTCVSEDPCCRLLLEFAQADAAPSSYGPLSELCKGLTQACRKQAPKTDRVAGSTIDQAVNATFAALVCRTPDLYEKLQKYGNLYYREYFSSEGQLLSVKKAILSEN